MSKGSKGSMGKIGESSTGKPPKHVVGDIPDSARNASSKRKWRHVPPDRSSYEVAVFCRKDDEAFAIETQVHFSKHDDYTFQSDTDGLKYAFVTGSIHGRNIVVVYIPATDGRTAALDCKRQFPCIKVAFIVGVCDATPHGIRRELVGLGNVIVADRVVQYDTKEVPGTSITSHNSFWGHKEGLTRFVDITVRTLELLQAWTPRTHDPYDGDIRSLASACHNYVCNCEEPACSARLAPHIHYGNVSSDVPYEELSEEDQVVAFDSDAADVASVFPTVVVKGVGSYIDLREVSDWRDRAANAAATCLGTMLEQASEDQATTKSLPDPYQHGEFLRHIEMTFHRANAALDQTDKVYFAEVDHLRNMQSCLIKGLPKFLINAIPTLSLYFDDALLEYRFYHSFVVLSSVIDPDGDFSPAEERNEHDMNAQLTLELRAARDFLDGCAECSSDEVLPYPVPDFDDFVKKLSGILDFTETIYSGQKERVSNLAGERSWLINQVDDIEDRVFEDRVFEARLVQHDIFQDELEQKIYRWLELDRAQIY